MPSPTGSSSQQETPVQDSREQDAVPQTGVIDVDGSDATETDGSQPEGRAKDKDKDKEEVAFDFQRFLDQMKTKGAEPVAKYLRSFLSNFSKRTFTVNDQVKIISDFLNFISARMRETEVWKGISDAEFDNAMEGMEKLVMNRLYDFTFTPQIARSTFLRPVTTDDLERDRVLSQRIALFGWVKEQHLDIPEGEGRKGFLLFAQQELLKINHYKAPRDKLICILNSCKVIFGLIRHLRKEEGADAFVPILIFVVLKANPTHLLSNVEFINRFRNPEKLQSEAGYYLSSLMGAVSFIESMDHTSLSNITQEEFENNVEEAIQSLPQSQPDSPSISHPEPVAPKRNVASPHAGEESAHPLAISTPGQTLSEDARRILQKTGDTISKPLNAIGRIFSDALDGVEGNLSYLPGPFGPLEVGRESRWEHDPTKAPATPRWPHPDSTRQNGQPPSPASVPQTPVGEGPYNPPIQTPYKTRVRRIPSPSFVQSPMSPGSTPESTPTRHGTAGPQTHQPLALGPSQTLLPPSTPPALPSRVQSLAQPQSTPGSPSWLASAHPSRTPTPSLDIAGMQAEIDMAHERASVAARDTLSQIFPGVDGEVVELVLEANGGDLGKSIEALLEMAGNS